MRWMFLALLFITTAPAAVAGKPNVIMIMTDDQRFDTIRALGNTEIQTPNLDKLVERGFTFRNAYCQGSMIAAVCAPSRTMVLTGRSLFRIPDPQAKTYEGVTLAEVFNDAGYRTLHVGKPGNSFRYAHEKFGTNVEIPHENAQTAKKCADAVIEYVKRQKSEKPFFVYWAPSVPHDPRIAPEEFQKIYDPKELTLSKNFMKKHPFDNGALDVRDEQLAAIPRDEREMRKHLADYYACISALDHEIGRMAAAVEDAGLTSNTVVIVTSDQGLAVGGRHGLMGKQNLYEHFKSPLIIVGPGIKNGRSQSLVYLFDLFATCCELAGAKTPLGVEGKSLLPIATGSGKDAGRPYLFCAYRDSQRMVRDERWKLIFYPKIDRVQLFDLHTDPDEIKDLAGEADQTKRVIEMKDALRREQKAWADPLAPRE